mmetsp:Transcript_10805/g.14944  ORF Transcript_10805/g.14944 Transcript_10805/m.14944 type:complete len:163 (+) Transcript_10805:1-489(+)
MCKRKEKKVPRNIKFLKIKVNYSHDIFCSINQQKIKGITNFRLFSKFSKFIQNKNFINNSLIIYLLKDKNKILKFKKKFSNNNIEKKNPKNINNFNNSVINNSLYSKYLVTQMSKLKPLDHITINLIKTFNMKSPINSIGIKNKFKKLSKQFHGENIKTNYN